MDFKEVCFWVWYLGISVPFWIFLVFPDGLKAATSGKKLFSNWASSLTRVQCEELKSVQNWTEAAEETSQIKFNKTTAAQTEELCVLRLSPQANLI